MKEHWLQAKALFAEAIELEPGERPALVESAEVAPEAREQALAMLRSFEEDETKFLQRPGSSISPGATPLPPEAPDIRQLGTVRIEGVIGRGAMGYVLRGHDERLDRPVAVKCLPATSSMTEEQTTRFETEARSIAQLDHPGIVTVYGLETSGDDSFIVMAHLAGPDLRDELETLRQGGPGVHLKAFGEPGYRAQVVELVRQVAEALDHAHRLDVIHRDVKPANLLFNDLGRLVLVDFGLARIGGTATMTMDSDVRGTVHYMSPEQARVLPDKTVDARTDIYALGCVLYELLTLEKPYPGDDFREVFVAKAAGAPRSPRSLERSIPLDLETICLVAMSRLPADRYKTAGDFAEDLARFLDHRSILARPPAPHVRALRWARRRRRGIALSGVAGAVTVATTLYGVGFMERRSWPEIQVNYLEGQQLRTGADPGGLFQSLTDPSTGLMTPWRSLGRLDGRAVRVRPGFSIFCVQFESGSVIDFSARLEVGDSRMEFGVSPEAVERSANRAMVRIPGGYFSGRSEILRDPGLSGSELDPQLIADAWVGDFMMDRTEVTHAQFFEFARQYPEHISAHWIVAGMVEDLGERDFRLKADAELPEHWAGLPVTQISFVSANAYAEWCGCRLPTVYELLYVASEFAGPEPGAGALSLDLSADRLRDPAEYLLPAATPSLATTQSGIVHLGGNAREWTLTPDMTSGIADYSQALLAGSMGREPDPRDAFPLTIVPSPRNSASIQPGYGFRCARSAPF